MADPAFNADAYQKALARIQELTGSPEGSPEEKELIALTGAVRTLEDALKGLVDTMTKEAAKWT